VLILSPQYILVENDYKGRIFFRVDQNKTRKSSKKNKSFPKQKVKLLIYNDMTILGQTKSFPKRIFLPESVLFPLENFLIFWVWKREVC